MARGSRVYYWFSGLLLIAGTVIFMNGGRQHPPINESMGQFGTPDFFVQFATLIQTDPNWEPVHAMIIAGPVLWTLGILALADQIRARGENRWSTFAIVTMAMGVTLHVVLYIFDGFVASKIATQLLSSEEPTRTALIWTFGANQWTVIRMSTVSWLLISLTPAALAIGMLTAKRALGGFGKLLQGILVVVGLVLGVFTLIATATGLYSPGPMVSPFYVPAAVSTALWFAVAGISVLLRERTDTVTPEPAAVGTATPPAERSTVDAPNNRSVEETATTGPRHASSRR